MPSSLGKRSSKKRPLDGTQVLGSAASLIRWLMTQVAGVDGFFNVDNEIPSGYVKIAIENGHL